MVDFDAGLLAQGLCGLGVFFGLAWLASENRRVVQLRPVGAALLVQCAFTFFTQRVAAVRDALFWLSEGIGEIKDATLAGTSFVFGYVGGAQLPFVPREGVSTFVFALQALPMVMVVSALAMLLFHWGVLPVLVRAFSVVMRRSLGIGGALGLCTAAKVFLGQTEAPLLIRPYISRLSRSELFTVMTLGMATTSASVMVIYAAILEGAVEQPLRHILTASLIASPAAIAVSRLMIPHASADTDGTLVSPYHFSGAMEAISQGASDGMKLFLNIIAMLIVMLAMVAIVNSMLAAAIPGHPLTLQDILGWVMAPAAWLMGIPWKEAFAAGNLLGTKTILNEVMAFIAFAKFPSGTFSPRSSLIMTYALCGFANFSSVGIQIGGIGTMAPERRAEIIALGFRALLAGILANCISATVVGILANFA